MAAMKLHLSSFCLWLLVSEVQGWFWWMRSKLSNCLSLYHSEKTQLILLQADPYSQKKELLWETGWINNCSFCWRDVVLDLRSKVLGVGWLHCELCEELLEASCLSDRVSTSWLQDPPVAKAAETINDSISTSGMLCLRRRRLCTTATADRE